jgi:hypothetical protein
MTILLRETDGSKTVLGFDTDGPAQELLYDHPDMPAAVDPCQELH